MQESPSYANYLSRFQNLNFQSVIDGKENISGSDRRFLESIYTRLKLYFEDDAFRLQIPLQKRQYIEDNHITNILSYIETIYSWQQDGSTLVNGGNLQNQITNLISQLEPFDAQLSGYYYTYISSDEPTGKRVQAIAALRAAADNESKSLKEVVAVIKEQVSSRKEEFDKDVAAINAKAQQSLDEKIETADKTLKGINEILEAAKLLSGKAGGHKLANYYQKLSNGRTTDENDEYLNKQGTRTENLLGSVSFKKIAMYFGIVATVAYPITLYLLTHPINLGLWETVFLIFLIGSTALLAITYVSIKTIHAFNRRYKGGHGRASAIWMIGAIAATIVTAVYSAILVHDLSSNGKITWEEIIPKIIVLLAPAYLVRLCIQNYRANAHLQVQYMHRATIVSIAETYSDATSLKNPRDQDNDALRTIAVQAKMLILTEAAGVMFAQSESGFITQKEGAGNNGDNPMDSFQNAIKLR